MEYLTLNQTFTAFIPIPGSSSGDTVSYVIYKGSNAAVFQSGSMTFVADEIWKCAFTPIVAGETYILKVHDTTIDSKREDFYQPFSTVTPSINVPTGDDLTTVAQFKIDFNYGITTHDTLIQNFITQNSKAIKKKCGRTFPQTIYDANASADDILYDVNQDQIVMVRNFPIISVQSINIDWDRNWGAATLLDSTNYVIYPEIGKIAFKYPFTYWYEQFFRYSPQAKVIQVLYTAGSDPLPADLTFACERLVMADLLESLGSVNVAASNDVIYKPDKLRKTAMAIIDNYKAWFSGE